MKWILFVSFLTGSNGTAPEMWLENIDNFNQCIEGANKIVKFTQESLGLKSIAWCSPDWDAYKKANRK